MKNCCKAAEWQSGRVAEWQSKIVLRVHSLLCNLATLPLFPYQCPSVSVSKKTDSELLRSSIRSGQCNSRPKRNRYPSEHRKCHWNLVRGNLRPVNKVGRGHLASDGQ